MICLHHLQLFYTIIKCCGYFKKMCPILAADLCFICDVSIRKICFSVQVVVSGGEHLFRLYLAEQEEGCQRC